MLLRLNPSGSLREPPPFDKGGFQVHAKPKRLLPWGEAGCPQGRLMRGFSGSKCFRIIKLKQNVEQVFQGNSEMVWKIQSSIYTHAGWQISLLKLCYAVHSNPHNCCHLLFRESVLLAQPFNITAKNGPFIGSLLSFHWYPTFLSVCGIKHFIIQAMWSYFKQ